MKNHKDNVGHSELTSEKSRYFGNNNTKSSCDDSKTCNEKKCHCGCDNCGCQCGCDDCNCTGKPKDHCCD